MTRRLPAHGLHQRAAPRSRRLRSRRHAVCGAEPRLQLIRLRRQALPVTAVQIIAWSQPRTSHEPLGPTAAAAIG